MSDDKFEAAFREYMHDRIMNSVDFEQKVSNTLIRDVATTINSLILEAHNTDDPDEFQENLVNLLAGVTRFSSIILTLIVKTVAKDGEAKLALTQDIAEEIQNRMIRSFAIQDDKKIEQVTQSIQRSDSIQQIINILHKSKTEGEH